MIDCSKDTELRDFVQHSVSVLHHLVAIGDNKGAISLLKDLNRCNLICGNVVLENNCGCGKSR